METHSFASLESCILGSVASPRVSRIRQLRIISRASSRRAVLLGKLATSAFRCHCAAVTLFLGVGVAGSDALAANTQSAGGGTYYGATDVLVNANEHLSCPTTLQFDPKTNSATVTVNYRGTDMTTKINGTFRDGAFQGRSEGRFYGLVYVQAMNYVLKFDRRSGVVKTTSWAVNPVPGSNNKPETDVYRRTPPRSVASDKREGEHVDGSDDDSSGDSNRSSKNKDGTKNRDSDIKTSHLKDTIVEAKDTGERTKLVKSDSTVSKTKAAPTTTHKK
jgi:hypothetical protein